jgi:hypothetical protein
MGFCHLLLREIVFGHNMFDVGMSRVEPNFSVVAMHVASSSFRFKDKKCGHVMCFSVCTICNCNVLYGAAELLLLLLFLCSFTAIANAEAL